MDDRVRRHAEILVDYCTDVGPDDDVLIKAPKPAEDLVVALYEQLGKIGARPWTVWVNRRASRAYAREMHPEDFRTPDHRLGAMEGTDVAILVQGSVNAAETSDVDTEKAGPSRRANQPILEERLDKRWVITQHPTAADAQQAELSTAAWTDFVYDAIDHDWAAQKEFQAQIADRLEAADEVRVVSGDDTDLRLSVDGMGVSNDHGKHNMPAGEVATSPVPDAVDGEITFDLPLVHYGREVRDARLVFEDGEVVDHAAGRNEEVLTSVLETDAGARRAGELGIGTNRGIDRFTNNILFDEKMGDTVHLALGNAMDDCVPDDREFNESAVHVDVLVDVSEDSRIEFDGEVVQRDGVFWFEEEFGGTVE